MKNKAYNNRVLVYMNLGVWTFSLLAFYATSFFLMAFKDKSLINDRNPFFFFQGNGSFFVILMLSVWFTMSYETKVKEFYGLKRENDTPWWVDEKKESYRIDIFNISYWILLTTFYIYCGIKAY